MPTLCKHGVHYLCEACCNETNQEFAIERRIARLACERIKKVEYAGTVSIDRIYNDFRELAKKE